MKAIVCKLKKAKVFDKIVCVIRFVAILAADCVEGFIKCIRFILLFFLIKME